MRQREVHRVVEDADRFDTSTVDTNLLVTELDTGEIRVEGQYEGRPFEAALPDPGERFLLVFDSGTESWSAVPVELERQVLIGYHVLRAPVPEPEPEE